MSSILVDSFRSRGGGGGSESMDGRGCAILALNFRINILPKNVFYQILCLPFQQRKLEIAISFVSHE